MIDFEAAKKLWDLAGKPGLNDDDGTWEPEWIVEDNSRALTLKELVDTCIEIHKVAYQEVEPEDFKGLPFINRTYYDRTIEDGISGDDVNRHLRESRMGFAEPSKDWSNCNEEIRCIWADQLMTRPECLTGKMYLHRYGWYHGCMIYQVSARADAELLYK